MNHIQLTFKAKDQSKHDELIAKLSTLEFTGFEETEDEVIAYAEEELYDAPAVDEIAREMGITFSIAALAHRNWNEEWEKNFEPVIIDGFCSIRASFHPKPDNVIFDIEITPKMSFGTGHHATTALMITLMRDLDFKHKTIFDFGTGTGILAILAEQLGASSILAIDNDEWSYENAVENCQQNQARSVEVRQATADDLEEGLQFDIILANINRHILLAYMEQMSALLPSGGILLLSGILAEDIYMVNNSAEANGLIQERVKDDKNWVCMQFRKQ
jgi:ribosomal protein L11 methyltransferase